MPIFVCPSTDIPHFKLRNLHHSRGAYLSFSLSQKKCTCEHLALVQQVLHIYSVFALDAFRPPPQMAEHKTKLEQQKRGEPGSKEAEVIHLQEAMEDNNNLNVSKSGVLCAPVLPKRITHPFYFEGTPSRISRRVLALHINSVFSRYPHWEVGFKLFPSMVLSRK